MGHKVTEKRPSTAITAMLLILLAEAGASNIPLSTQAEQFITPCIDYLYATLGEQEPNVWDEETEAYEQIIQKERKTTVRAWQHISTPWCLQALVLHNQELGLQRSLTLLRSITADLEQQADEGYFRLLEGSEADRSYSVFATALHLKALADVMHYVDLMDEGELPPSPIS